MVHKDGSGKIHTTRYINTQFHRSWDHDGYNNDISGDHFVDDALPKNHPHRKVNRDEE